MAKVGSIELPVEVTLNVVNAETITADLLVLRFHTDASRKEKDILRQNGDWIYEKTGIPVVIAEEGQIIEGYVKK